MPDGAQPVRRSPLAHRAPIAADGGAVRIAERPFLAKFILRVDPAEAAERIGIGLGVALPREPLTSSAGDGLSLLWMGPDEWMLVAGQGAADRLRDDAAAALAGVHCQIVDVSDYYTVIEVAGPRARELLMKLTTLDLHRRAFRPGMAAGAIFGRAQALIHQLAEDGPEDEPRFHLFVRWSMADYLWVLLAAAGGEWGAPSEAAVKGERLTID